MEENEFTYIARLWIDNDEYLYKELRLAATTLSKTYPGDHTRCVSFLADTIRNMLEDANPLSKPNIFTDLINHALYAIDYRDIAEAFFEP